MFRGVTSIPENNVLVVDDSPTSRLKLAAAVRHLGHNVLEADGGVNAMKMLDEQEIHLVLLDIIMPDMDGYEVLREMQKSERHSEIPVLVISSVDDMSGVVEAIDLGAVDFLPKDVDPKLLKARVESSLEKKRLRDLELAYLRDVARMTDAARVVRESGFNPEHLSLEPVMRRKDSLGELARVFGEMASDVYRREVAFRRQIDLLRGGFLLIVIGVLTGLYPALAKILVVADTNNPVGMTAWVAVVTMAVGLIGTLFSGKFPQFSWAKIRFALIVGPFSGAFPQIALFYASEHIPAVVMSITLAMQSLIVFLITTLLGLERPRMRRLMGLMLGLTAVGIAVIPTSSGASNFAVFWIFVAMMAPLSFALEGIIFAAVPNPKSSAFEIVFFAMLGSAVWAWAGAFLLDVTIMPSELEGTRITLIAAIGVISGVATWLFAITVRKTGTIFASQYGYITTIMGVLWSLVLLDETASRWIWLALACMLTGMVLVRPREADDMVRPEKSDDRRDAGVAV